MIQSKVTDEMKRAEATILGLAASTGLAQRTIMRARGPLIARCTLETLATIAKALGCRVRDLFEEAGE